MKCLISLQDFTLYLTFGKNKDFEIPLEFTVTLNKLRFININKLNDLFIKNWELKLDRKKIDTFDSPHIENGYILQKQNKIL